MNTNAYINQKDRALSRKRELIKLMGGKCCRCGYDNNYAALEFHHINPSEKSFQLDSRHLSNTSMELIIKESKKCILVCSNCHKEIHHPNLDSSIVDEIDFDKKSLFESKRKQSICPVCGRSFDYVNNKTYCSEKCRYADKGYPSKKEVEDKYNELKSKTAVANYYGLTRKIITGILNREE